MLAGPWLRSQGVLPAGFRDGWQIEYHCLPGSIGECRVLPGDFLAVWPQEEDRRFDRTQSAVFNLGAEFYRLPAEGGDLPGNCCERKIAAAPGAAKRYHMHRDATATGA